MRENVTNEQVKIASANPLQDRISLLNEKGFLWREIAELTDLPKKLIKGIAKGKFVPTDEEGTRLCKVIDETITRLGNSKDESNQNSYPEADLHTIDPILYKLEVKNVCIFKGTDDDKMIVKIQGIILNPSNPV